MQTPWGKLTELDLGNSRLVEEIVCSDKHCLVEGLIVERLFDQIFEKIPGSAQVIPLDVETVIAVQGREDGRQDSSWIAFVWARAVPWAVLGGYLAALERRFRPYLLEYDPGRGFLAQPVAGGRPAGDRVPLTELLEKLSGRAPKPFTVDSSVRDQDRLLQAFQSEISGYYGPRTGERVVLPRLLINWGIQPYFDGVWNLDRVFVRGNHIWLLEVKHKYPIDLPPKGGFPTLRFGINTGELEVIGRLEQAGVRCLHAVLVKPVWSADIGIAELLTGPDMRERMALIGVELDRRFLDRINLQPAKVAARHTTIDGTSEVRYRTLAAGRFSSFGRLSDAPVAIAGRLLRAMAGQPHLKVREA